MNTTIYPSGMRIIDDATGGGVAAGHPWLIIDERASKVRKRWFSDERFQSIEVLREATPQETRARVQQSVFNDTHLVVVAYASSAKLEADFSVVMRVIGGELVVTKNNLGNRSRPRAKLPS